LIPNNSHSCITYQAISYKAHTWDSPYRTPSCACVFLRYNDLQVFPFQFSSQAFTGLDTSLGAMMGQMLRFKENTNNKCTTLYYKVFTITMGTYISFSQDSNDYNTVSVYDPVHHHHTSTAPTSRHQILT